MRTPAEANETYDYVVCTTKATDPTSTTRLLAPAIDEDKTTIVIIQNGVGNEDPFRKAFPKCPILSCVVSDIGDGLVHLLNLADMGWCQARDSRRGEPLGNRAYTDRHLSQQNARWRIRESPVRRVHVTVAGRWDSIFRRGQRANPAVGESCVERCLEFLDNFDDARHHLLVEVIARLDAVDTESHARSD